MNREAMLSALEDRPSAWDLLIIGGGATGLGCAVDAAARGYRTLLVEQSDFAKGTSSRSTKLIHGGVRYLQQGNVALVLEALRERGLLTQNAPHLVSHLSFIVPTYTWWEAPFYGVGLKLYDLLAGKLGLQPSRHLTREDTLKRLPTLEPGGLRGGIVYYDGQFDDARLAVCLAQTAASLGAVLMNYAQVLSLVKRNDLVRGAIIRDVENNREHEVTARAVVNATGVFTDEVRQMDDPTARKVISPSQGVHIVLDRAFLPGDSAIMVPRTDDGRVLFAIPWLGRVLIGTTDTAVSRPELEPRPLRQEIDFLLTHAARYLTKDPMPEDVLSAFAGLRPLVKSADNMDTASTPRDHSVMVSKSGLVSVTGGKWTTYRKMAQDTVDQAALVAGLAERPCTTEHLRLHGVTDSAGRNSGSVASPQSSTEENPNWNEPLHPRLPYHSAEVVRAVREEMARTVEDVLSRRTRSLLLDARASIEAAPAVAQLMAREIGRGEAWVQAQLADYRELAAGYLIH
jgi:glycerol-3-phosphate dehydrogenase